MKITRRQFTRATGTGVAFAWLPSLSSGQDPESTAVDFVTPATQRAISKALDYLARRQNDDGSFGGGGYSRNVAICALGGMALMSGGNTPGRGPHGAKVNRCVDYLLANTQEGGFIAAEGASSHGPMYGHGFATLFLAEAYGMSQRMELGGVLDKAVKRIVEGQNKDGGWRYQPGSEDADVSVTVCQVMALRAARNAGIHVPAEVIDRSVEYLRRAQNPDGGFMYMIEGGPSAFPRSAAAIVALYSAGIYEGDEIVRGLDYLMQSQPRGDFFNRQQHYFYGHYYAVQAMWQAGGEYWRKWYPAIRDQLLARQRDDGSWLDTIGPEYGTAMAAIILQMPNNYLPIFQR